jgi:hypothetical protein
MATDNPPSWGYTRIQGALANLDYQIGRGTIATILRQHGIEPAPERQKRTTWREVLTAHWSVVAATDFFTVEVWTGDGLTRATLTTRRSWFQRPQSGSWPALSFETISTD